MRRQSYKACIEVMLLIIISVGCLLASIRTAKEPEEKKEIYVNAAVTREVRNTYLAEGEPQPVQVVTEKADPEPVSEEPAFPYSRDWDAEESYLLARIAMAEAEGENIQSKTLVILTVLNRLMSEEFPDSIHDVIFEKSNGVYQFSCIGNGRWDAVEPNEDCWEAVEVVQSAACDYSDGALYFEACADEDNWHSRNLEFLYQSGNIRFYR